MEGAMKWGMERAWKPHLDDTKISHLHRQHAFCQHRVSVGGACEPVARLQLRPIP